MSKAVYRQWLCEPLPAEVRVALARLQRFPDVRHLAVMPDVHLARDVCIGTVLGTSATIYPQAVGGDIGCGMATVRLRGLSLDARSDAAAARVLGALRHRVPVLRHADPRPMPEALTAALATLSPRVATRRLLRDLAVEFGTVGRGNHFVELQRSDDDEEDCIWLLVHTGSRALGPAVRARWIGATPGLVALPVAGGDGGDGDAARYLRDHDTAIAFAAANRRACIDGVLGVLQQQLGIDCAPDPSTFVDVVHNFVRRERHGSEELWVHRKGAASAALGEPGIVPGSMGTATVHTVGRGVAASLSSCSHGAGRRLARGEAKRRISPERMARELRGVHYDRRLAARIRDEAPSAYKDLRAVLRAQRDLIGVRRWLRPVLVHKGA
ncbi:MAG: RtcB family protein [Planctomycetota bacterium]